MQQALKNSLIILILREVKKTGREKFPKHQNPKSGKKINDLVLLVDTFFCSIEELTESNV